jgi:hypothetical protein
MPLLFLPVAESRQLVYCFATHPFQCSGGYACLDVGPRPDLDCRILTLLNLPVLEAIADLGASVMAGSRK